MLLEMSLPLRLVLLLVLGIATVRFTTIGLQNGILILLATGMTAAWLIRGEGGLPNLTLDRVVWPLVFLIFLAKFIQGKTERLALDSVEFSMLAVLAVSSISMYFYGTYKTDRWGDEKLRMADYLSGFVLPYGSYFLMRRGAFSFPQIKSFMVGVALITLYLGITGLGEAFHQDWLVYPKYILDPNLGTHHDYARGPFLSASRNGMALAMGLPILFCLLYIRPDHSRLLWLLTILSVLIVQPYIFQRSAWLSAIMAFGVTALAWPKQRAVLIGSSGLVLATGVVLVLSSSSMAGRVDAKINRSGTIDFRMNLIEKSLDLIRTHPLTGIGFYRFREVIGEDEDFQAPSHNTPLTLFVELGLVGFLPFLAIYVTLLLNSVKPYLQQPSARMIIATLWGTTAAYLVTMNLTDTRDGIYHNVLLFAFWGMILSVIRRQPLTPRTQSLHSRTDTKSA